MERYTTKISNCIGNGYKCDINNTSAIVKLGQLEDIEEELGIDLITLFKYVDDNKIKEFVECFKFETMDNPNVVKIKIKKDKSEE